MLMTCSFLLPGTSRAQSGMWLHIVCHLLRNRVPEAENATSSYDAKVAFECSYLIASSAKSLFKPPQTHWKTMVSCFLQESQGELEPPNTVVLGVGVVTKY